MFKTIGVRLRDEECERFDAWVKSRGLHTGSDGLRLALSEAGILAGEPKMRRYGRPRLATNYKPAPRLTSRDLRRMSEAEKAEIVREFLTVRAKASVVISAERYAHEHIGCNGKTLRLWVKRYGGE